MGLSRISRILQFEEGFVHRGRGGEGGGGLHTGYGYHRHHWNINDGKHYIQDLTWDRIA